MITVGQDKRVNELKERLRTDLNDAMRARDQVRLRTLRLALTSITNEEVSGDSARELSDEEVLKVLTREAKKRREAAEAFDGSEQIAGVEADLIVDGGHEQNAGGDAQVLAGSDAGGEDGGEETPQEEPESEARFQGHHIGQENRDRSPAWCSVLKSP